MSEPAKAVKIRLGDVLVAQKVVTAAQLSQALELQKRTGRRLGRVFVENGFVTRRTDRRGALARQLGIPYINLKFYNVEPRAGAPAARDRRRAASARSCWRTARELCWSAWPTRPTCSPTTRSRALLKQRDRAGGRQRDRTAARDRPHLPPHRGDHRARAGARAGPRRHATSTSARSAPRLGAGGRAGGASCCRSVFEDAIQVRASDIHIEPQESTPADPLPHRRRAARADRGRHQDRARRWRCA